MTDINKLSAVDSVSDGDQIPMYSVDSGGTRRVSVRQLVNKISEYGAESEHGIDGRGVPFGGLEGQYLAKKSAADFDTEWVDIGAVEGLGTVTSVALSVPTGLSVSGSPINSSGTIDISLASGRVIPLAADVASGVSAYEWGDHALAGYAPAVETVQVITGAAPELTTVGGNIKTWTLTEASTFTLGLSSGEAITMHVTLAGFALTMPSVRWPDGTGPTLSVADENVIEFWRVGSSTYGAFVGVFPL